MSRWLISGPALCGMAAMLAAMPVPLRADVMEIGGAGHSWIAGGPQAPVRFDATGASFDLPLTQGAAQSAPITEITPGAGPAQWQGRVAELAAKYDISPALLEALVWQESRWNTRAVSHAGARGLAQLMPGTARQLGVNSEDPHANLEGGARYLRQQLDTFDGNVEKALAAYNAGPGRVIKAGGIPAITETRNYVAAILARLSAPVRR